LRIDLRSCCTTMSEGRHHRPRESLKRYLLGNKSAKRGSPASTHCAEFIGVRPATFPQGQGPTASRAQVVQGDEVEEFWELKNVSFEVKQGDEILAIIGRNGAGQSTLSKSEPHPGATEGRVMVRACRELLRSGTALIPSSGSRKTSSQRRYFDDFSKGEIRKKLTTSSS